MDEQETPERIGKGSRHMDRAIWMAVGGFIAWLVYPGYTHLSGYWLHVSHPYREALTGVAVVAVGVLIGFGVGTLRERR